MWIYSHKFTVHLKEHGAVGNTHNYMPWDKSIIDSEILITKMMQKNKSMKYVPNKRKKSFSVAIKSLQEHEIPQICLKTQSTRNL